MGMYSQFFVLFSVIGVGFFSKKLRIISNNMNQDLGNFIIYVSMPALIYASIISFSFTKELVEDMVTLLMIAFCLYIFFIIVAFLYTKLLRMEGTKKDIIQFTTIFANTGFMGFPIALIFFGEKGLFYAVVLNMLYDVFVWTYGVLVLQRSKCNNDDQKKKKFSMLKELLNPCFMAVIIGLITLLASVKVPLPAVEFLNMIGTLSPTLAMIFIGSMLADMNIKSIFSDITIFLGSIMKLVFLPLMVVVILKLLGFSGLMLAIPALLSGMPAAATTPVLAEKYGNNSYFASQVVFVTTLFSAVTIPCMIYFVL